jgi:hypothetical protein
MPRKTRSPNGEEDHIVVNLPPIERRSLMESAMHTRTTRLDRAIVAAFLLALLALLAVFLTPVITSLIRDVPHLFTGP